MRFSLEWCHNVQDCVSNQQPHDCLLDRLFWCISTKISKLRLTGLCVGNSPVNGEFPAQRAINADMFPFDDIIIFLCPKRSPQIDIGTILIYLTNTSALFSTETMLPESKAISLKWPFSAHSKLHGYWWSGGARNQASWSHGISLALPDYTGFNIHPLYIHRPNLHMMVHNC